MLPEIIAIVSAMGWAGDSVLVRLGTQKSNIVAAMLISFSVAAATVWSYLLLFTSLEFLTSPAMFYFIVSGCLQPLFARALYYNGITRIGVARAGPLRSAEPLFAAAIAFAFLGERPPLLVYLGTILIVTSIWVISWQPGGKANWRVLDCVFPLGAALISAVSQNLRKQGLFILPDAFVASAVTTSTSLVLFLLFVISTGRTGLLRMERRSFKFFMIAALIATSAQVLNFVALRQGDVSVMIPLLNTTPLFAVLFSGLFLRSVEKVTGRIIVGAALMVGGVMTITLR